MPWRVPVDVAVTTALAQGGVLFGGALPSPPGATAIDLPVNRVPVSVPASGSTTITWPAVPAGQRGMVTAIGMSTDDFANTRITTRVNGVAVPPFNQIVGTVGDLTNPPSLAVPILLGPGDVFSILLENLDAGAPHNMIARALGWEAA